MPAARIAIVSGVLICAAGLLSAPLALALGIGIGVTLGNPWSAQTARAGRILLQTAVIGLGFGLSLVDVWRTGQTALLLTALVVAGALSLGIWLGGLLGVPGNTSRLVAVGTAICGGSAIAAIAPVLRADDEEVASALAAVFTLNAAGLFLFPLLGAALGLGQVEFGYWAALAIHDTSSVIAAGSIFGASALGVATTVKLTRAAWIVPVALLWAWRERSAQRANFPWFIVGFVAAALLRALLPTHVVLWDALAAAARHLLVVILFLIGTGMTRQLLRFVGPRPMLHALLLWLIVAGAMLLAVRSIPLPL